MPPTRTIRNVPELRFVQRYHDDAGYIGAVTTDVGCASSKSDPLRLPRQAQEYVEPVRLEALQSVELRIGMRKPFHSKVRQILAFSATSTAYPQMYADASYRPARNSALASRSRPRARSFRSGAGIIGRASRTPAKVDVCGRRRVQSECRPRNGRVASACCHGWGCVFVCILLRWLRRSNAGRRRSGCGSIVR